MAGSGRLALRSVAGQGWVRGSGPAVLSRLRDAAVVRPGFLSAAEEETLSSELEPQLRRRRYEYDHWDAVRLLALGAEPQRGGTWDVRGGTGSGALGWARLHLGAGPGNGGSVLKLRGLAGRESVLDVRAGS